MNSYRMERINGLLRDEISRVLFKEVKNPLLNALTVTAVKISRDLGSAVVYFSSMSGGADIQNMVKALDKSSGYIRALLKKRLYIKKIPTLKFQYDESIEYGMRIDRILRELDKNAK